MDIRIDIRQAENELKKPLEDFFNSIYPAEKLISHGIDHHRRVWGFAKELLTYSTDALTYPLIARKLLIACYLHDIGMAVDTGTKHGLQSRYFCEKFLKKHNLPETECSDLLQAVEYHDDKEYIVSGNKNIIHMILTSADDLDAFGYTGIYRYSEIYLLRGIPLADLGIKIIHNACKRFDNFRTSFASHTDLIARHRGRYEILRDFFTKYNQEIIKYDFNNTTPVGVCGIIALIKYSLDRSVSPEHFQNVAYTSEDTLIKEFFINLNKEASWFL